MQKTQRNDPCPCGSQKKFKHCCLAKAVNIPPIEADREWQKLRQMEGKLWEGAFAFASEKWGPEIIADGWDNFCLDMDVERDSPDGKHLFPGWFIFRWIPFDYSEQWKDLGSNMTLADLYLQEKGLKDYELFLSVIDRSPFSFFLVEDVIPSRRIILKDLLLERTATIKETAGAVLEFKGRVVFARLISCGDQAIQIGFGTTPLPLRYAMEILDLKKDILAQEKTLTPTTLLKYDNDLREAYFLWSASAYQLPEMRNSDGHSIILCTLHYKLTCSPKMAFDQLISLCKGEDPEEALEEEGFHKKGELYSIEFPWLKNRSSDLILGDIKIKGSKLTIQVNSIERSKKMQQEIEKRLPEAIFEKEDRKPLDLENVRKKKLSAPSQPTAMEKEVMRAFLENHYQSWLDTPLPALNGKTPRQAAKTAEGRERLEFLLLDFEMSNQNQSRHLPIDVQTLRQELGLLPLLK
ncbi:MAG: SEC-C domain-containing protein [Simkania negevensis]|nr:SEC-C domain-containing protein [Simkania negevensis]